MRGDGRRSGKSGEGQVRFRLPFVNFGLTPEAGSTFLPPKLTGYRRTAELVFFGEFFDSLKALEFGILNQVFPDDEVEDAALKAARRLARQPPNALRLSKSLLKQDQLGMMEAISKEGKIFVELVKGHETREIIEAFMEGRKSDFSRV